MIFSQKNLKKYANHLYYIFIYGLKIVFHGTCFLSNEVGIHQNCCSDARFNDFNKSYAGKFGYIVILMHLGSRSSPI